MKNPKSIAVLYCTKYWTHYLAKILSAEVSSKSTYQFFNFLKNTTTFVPFSDCCLVQSTAQAKPFTNSSKASICLLLSLILAPFFFSAQAIGQPITAIIHGATYRNRADALINQVVNVRFDAKREEVRGVMVYCAARYLRGRDTAYANQQMNILLDRALKGDAYMHFTTLAVMETYLLCKPMLNAQIRDKMRRYMQSINFNFSGGGTYNLTLMPHAAAYLACEEWPDFKDKSGRTHDQIQKFSKDLLMRYLKNMFYEHNQEVDAPTYYPTNFIAVKMLADFSQDEPVQRAAFSCYQLMMAIMNGCYNNGLYVAAPWRSKGWNNLGDGLKNATALNSFAWLLFGKASDRFYYQALAESKGAEVFNFWLAYPGYTQPKPSILEGNTNKIYPYTRRSIGFKRTYQSASYGLATRDIPKGDPFGIDYWKESKRLYLAWQSDTVSCHFTIDQENRTRSGDVGKKNSFGYGENPFCRVMQHNGTATGIWNVPYDSQNPAKSYEFYKLYIPFNKSTFKAILRKNGWVVCHTGTMMFAVKVQSLQSKVPYTWDTKSKADFEILWLNARKGYWVLETTELAPYAGGGVNEELNRFADSLHSKTSFATFNETGATPQLQYKALSGDVLDITYFDPNRDYQNQFKLNGKAYTYSTLVVDDPTAYQALNTGSLQVRSNGSNIDAITYAAGSTNSIKVVDRSTQGYYIFSTHKPSATYHWIFPEGTRFLNNTTAFSAAPYVELPYACEALKNCSVSVFVEDGKCKTNYTIPIFDAKPGATYTLSSLSEEGAKKAVRVYPNPGFGTYTLDNLPPGKLEVKIIDLSGHSIRTYTVTDQSSLPIDLSEVPKGLYYIVLNGRNVMNYHLSVIKM